MKIHLMSDIHLEFHDMDGYEPPECDVVVLAGDIGTGIEGVHWARETFMVPVIMVMGNHEPYVGKVDIPKLMARMKGLGEGYVHVLDNEVVEINGVRFLGGTLWTDFNLYGNPALGMIHASDGMNDYRRIKRDGSDGNGWRLRPIDTLAMHRATRAFIEKELSKPGNAVVVTHHLPSERSLDPRFPGDALNPAFASNLEGVIDRRRPNLWLHGHTHIVADYMIGETRIVCNPRGYPGEMTGFNPGLVIDL